MSIQEFCRLTNISPHTLRYYERAGIMPRVERNASGHRRYTERDLLWLRFLRHLRMAGMSVAAIRRYTALLNEGSAGDQRRLAMLRQHREAVIARLEELKRHLALIDRKLRIGCAPNVQPTGTRARTRTTRRTR